VKVDFYALRKNGLQQHEPDLERELTRTEAVARAKCGDVVLVKIWLRTDDSTGLVDLDQVEAAVTAAVTPLGLR
jgi:hypothetical protein